MEPDPAEARSPEAGPGVDEKLEASLAYLRGLAGDPAVRGEDVARALEGEAEEGGGLKLAAAGAGDPSVLKRLADELGSVPVLDLPSPDDTSRRARGAGELSPGDPGLSDERYLVEGEIAAGGMGRILNVYDQDIRRRVAMKVLRRSARDRRVLAKFLEEAQATGQLEHPNIAPIYDIGVDREHGVYFTMKLVRGRNLREILRDLSIGREETRRRFTLTRLVQILQQVAMGVHYAHVRGVVHRDLKPDNIMVGDYGEVLVMDWGLAKFEGRSLDEAAAAGRSGARQPGLSTVDGRVSGTLAYMAPEQARGWIADIDARTDIFGLGAILYEILTYHSPYEGDDPLEVLAQAGACVIVPPHVRAARNVIPASLEAICTRALAARKEDRYPDAMAFHEDLQVFLDGTLEAQRRQEEAAILTRQAEDRAREYLRLAEVENGLRLEAREALAGLQPHDPDMAKMPGWKLEDLAAETRQARIRTFNEATALLHSAINVDESSTAAKEALADLYWARLEEAERAGNTDDMIIYRGLVDRYQQGKFTALLEGKGLLSIETEPSGARVSIHRMVERGRRLVAESFGREPAGETPLALELPIGHYLVRLEREGCRPVRCPVLVERGGRHMERVHLYSDEEIGAGFILVPAGDCTVGGDARAPGSLPLQRRYASDLFVGEFPVTFREYCRFLDELAAAGDPELEKWLPRLPHLQRDASCVRPGAAGLFEPDREALDIDRATAARHPPGFEWDLPVLGVSWYAASRYARWLAERSGRKARLLRDGEWEKAARGVARTIHPWGDRFDWSFVRGGLSRPERAQPEPVGTFPGDVSIYGVRDLAGTIREWCEDWFLEQKYRVTRGGGWNSVHEGAFRSAHRFGTQPEYQGPVIGFRVAIEPPRRR
jgi:serine/threonine-protein kinase